MSKKNVVEITENMLLLTRDDHIVWDYKSSGYYVASFNGKKFHLRCLTKEPTLSVDDKRYNIGKDNVMLLCCGILDQALKLRNQSEELDDLNEWLKGNMPSR